jgi:hypothetical protein
VFEEYIDRRPRGANGADPLTVRRQPVIKIQFAGLMRDLTGSYTLPCTIAGLLLLPAALVAFSIREKQNSAQARNRLASTHVGAQRLCHSGGRHKILTKSQLNLDARIKKNHIRLPLTSILFLLY